MSFSSASQLSLQDFLNYPEIEPAREYIAGKIYQKPRLRGKQERVLNRLLETINQTGKRQKSAYAFSNLRCSFENYSLVPDITVFHWNNLPVDSSGNLLRELIPNWIIQILSPEEHSIRSINNILICLQRGAQLGWLVDVMEQKVIAFPEGEQPEIKQKDDCLPVLEGLGTLKLSVRDLFYQR
ncbi:MAG: hypothetical protein BRC33_09955 [Cyanobacteria bacterium SW_9_44_58]|nr:MAG: hypothetical protein BRC33_09955 [Cyanobacteria bacterium SW_9_44_58]